MDYRFSEKQKFERIKIPHSYNLYESLSDHKTGFGWYSTEIKISNKKNCDRFLKFEGVCLRCKVFVDGKQVGICNQTYMPFCIDITKYTISKNSIRIDVQVDNRLLKNDIPDKNCNGWWIYGGMIREVYLIQIPKKRIEIDRIRTLHVAKDSFSVLLSYKYNNDRPDSILLNISGIKNPGYIYKYVIPGTTSLCSMTVKCVQPWSPEDPVLYNFKLIPYWKNKAGDVIEFKRGFCQLKVADGRLILNGKPIFLRGIGRHDVIGENGPILSRSERVADLVSIKESGANMLRIAHFPQHSDIYEICDSLGLIVMDEMPAWKTYSVFLGDTSGQNMASEYMLNLIKAHGNYTCIGLWCIGNEISSIEGRIVNYVKYVSDFVKRNDPERLVTYTTYFYEFDKAFQYVDVASVNEYFGWYLGSIDMIPSLLQSVKRISMGKPIIVTEFGASATLGMRNKDAKLSGPVKSLFVKDFSEDFEALFNKDQINTIWDCRRICSGAVVWCYNDFYEYRIKPNGNMPDVKKGINGMGLVTMDRKKKIAYDTVKECFLKIKSEMKEEGGY